MEKINIIYKVTNIFDNSVYIGATTNSLHQRKLDHEERANRGEASKFHHAISTFGSDAFTWEQVDTASSTDELAKKEKEYIINYESKENGYNNDEGGGFKKTIYQYSKKDGSLINNYDCLENAGKAVGVYKNSIGNACIGQNKTCKGYYWSYNFSVPFNPEKDLRKKRVIQYSISGKQLAVYESVAEASRQSGISKTCIARACRGEREKSGGYIWKYQL